MDFSEKQDPITEDSDEVKVASLAQIRALLNEEIEDQYLANSLYEALDNTNLSIKIPNSDKFRFQKDTYIDNKQIDSVFSIQQSSENSDFFFQILDKSFTEIQDNILRSAFMLPLIRVAVETIPNTYTDSNNLIFQKLDDLKSTYIATPSSIQGKGKIVSLSGKVVNLMHEFRMSKEQLIFISERFKKSFAQIERIKRELIFPMTGEESTYNAHKNSILENEKGFVPKVYTILYDAALNKVEKEYGTSYQHLDDLLKIIMLETDQIHKAINAIIEINRNIIKDVMDELKILTAEVDTLELFYIGYQALNNSIYDFSLNDGGNFVEHARAHIQRTYEDVRKEFDVLNKHTTQFNNTPSEISTATGGKSSDDKFFKKIPLINLPPILHVSPIISQSDLLAENRKRIRKKYDFGTNNLEDQLAISMEETSITSEEIELPVTKSKLDFKFDRRISFFSKQVGDRAEEIVFRYLKVNLTPDQAKTLRWKSKEGETPGWDIEYMDEQNMIKAIEVKGTTGSEFPDIELTDNEWQAAINLKEKYSIYLVTDCISKKPKIQEIRNPNELKEKGFFEVSPILWRILKRNNG